MWFRKVRFRNVGPFDDLSVDLTRGSVGIFGRNGRGKSTFLNLMYAAVTGDFGRFAGVKTDCIRNTADKGAESFVYAEVEHGPHVLQITRNLKTGKTVPNTVLVVDGGTPITNADKAADEIEAKLGADKTLIDLYVFKPQDRVYDFLTTIPSARAKAYQALCRTEQCEEIWNELGEYLNKDKALNEVVADNSDELTQRASELDLELAAIAERVGHAEEKLLGEKSKASAEEIVRNSYRRVQLEEDKLEVESALRAAEEEAEKYVQRVSTRTARLAEDKKLYESGRAQADAARSALRGWEQYRKYRRRKKQLAEEADALAAEARKKVEPVRPNDFDRMREYADAKIEALGRYDRSRKALANLTLLGTVECPTCGTPVTKLGDHIADLRKDVDTLPQVAKEMQAKVDVLGLYKGELNAYREWQIGHKARTRANQEARDALQAVDAPDGTQEDLERWLKLHEAQREQYEEARERLAKAERTLAGYEAEIGTQKKRLGEIARGIEETTEEPELVERARTRLGEHAAAVNEIASLNGEAKGLRRQKEDAAAELKKLRAKLRRGRRLRAVAKTIEVARDAFHRDRLPKRVAATNLATMEGDVNANLALFGDPFWVEANDSLSFTANKPGEPPQPAERLSTGQRVVLALSFWPAVASLWSSDLGMLALDEPTANLDADNRKFLGQALGAMTAKARGQRQLIMVTHDPDLRSSFDQVVDL